MTVLLELVLNATFAGQEIINRWNYLGTGTPGEGEAAIALIQAFGCIPTDDVYPDGLPFKDMLNLQHPGLVYQFASCRDVYSDTDFAEVPFVPAAAGLNANGQSEAPFVAYGFRTNRTVFNIRRGTKRLAGVAEGGVNAGGLIEDAEQALMVLVAAAWSANLTQTVGDNDYTFAPVIVSKMRYTPPDMSTEDPAGTAYAYWPTYAAQSDHIAATPTWEIYNHVRSQTSRQYGKGR